MKTEKGKYVLTMIEVPLDGSPVPFDPPDGYPMLIDWKATTCPEWRGTEDEGSFIQEPCVIARWGKGYEVT